MVTAVLFVSKYVLKSETSGDKNTLISTTDGDDEKLPGKPDIEQLKAALSPGIDSVLRNFGIKPEWIKNESTGSQGDNIVLKCSALNLSGKLFPSDVSVFPLKRWFSAIGSLLSTYLDINRADATTTSATITITLLRNDLKNSFILDIIK